MKKGGNIPCVLNAANEVAVAAFLAGKIGFMDIVAASQSALDTGEGIATEPADLESVYEIDRIARIRAEEWVQNRAR